MDVVTIDVDCSGPYDVAISADNLRGGIVGAAFDNVYFTGGTDLGCGGFDGPACWLSLSQCNGDTDDDNDVDTNDWPKFRDGFGLSYPNAAYVANCCADFDQDGDIDTNDWPTFRDNFGGTVADDCTQPQGTWPPTP